MLSSPFSRRPGHLPRHSTAGDQAVGDYLFVSKLPYGYSRHSFPREAMPLNVGHLRLRTQTKCAHAISAQTIQRSAAKSMEQKRTSGLIRRLPILLCTLLMGVAQCMASDEDWTVVTLARDGSWGVACRSTQAQAIAEAIQFCRAMAGPSSDCGAQFAATRSGWTVANLCGDHKVIATGSSLVDAEKEALIREVDLQLFYVPDLPPCRRVVTVDPSGTIVANNRQYSTAP